MTPSDPATETTRFRWWSPALLGTCCLMIAAIETLRFGADPRAWWASPRLTPVEGRIAGTSLNGGDEGQRKGMGGRWRLGVRYEYEVDGVSYQNRQFSVAHRDERFQTADAAHSARAALPDDSRITIFYDPERPATAVRSLSQESVTWNNIMPATLGAAGLVLLAIAGTRRAWRIARAPGRG